MQDFERGEEEGVYFDTCCGRAWQKSTSAVATRSTIMSSYRRCVYDDAAGANVGLKWRDDYLERPMCD